MPTKPETSDYYNEWIKMADMELSSDAVAASDSAFIIVDMQNDFVGEFMYSEAQLALDLSPCNALTNSSAGCFGVKEGATAAHKIASVLRDFTFNSVWASADDHHSGHCSFEASAGTVNPPRWCDKMLRECDPAGFTNCSGTAYLVATAAGGVVKGPFPPHCLRGSPGAALYSTVQQALTEYSKKPDAPLSMVMKGIDVSTDSFGVLPYSQGSWDIYRDAGMFDPAKPVPAALIRSGLTWEKNMETSTGANAYTLPFSHNYVSSGPSFSDVGHAEYSGMYDKQSAEVGIRKAKPTNIVVSGLAGDWCVLDTALNAAVLFPDAAIYYLLDASRPSFLPKQFAAPYFVEPTGSGQCSSQADGCWLHPPQAVQKLLKQAGVKVITTANLR